MTTDLTAMSDEELIAAFREANEPLIDNLKANLWERNRVRIEGGLELARRLEATKKYAQQLLKEPPR